MSSDNCTVGPNGKLLDTSQIHWVHDPDDNEHMAPVTTSSTDQCQLSATTLDSFITKVPLATHRSTCAARPSTKLTNPDNAMALKCKLSNTATANPSCCAHQASPGHKEDKATEPEPTNTEDDDPVDPEVAYEEMKALGDADHEVCVHCSSWVSYLTLCKGHACEAQGRLHCRRPYDFLENHRVPSSRHRKEAHQALLPGLQVRIYSWSQCIL